jgi:hypothetical protein
MISVLELNVNCASAATLHFEMHANEANMVAAMRAQMWPMREPSGARLGGYKRKMAQGTPGITNLSLGDHHGYTVPHYHVKHRHGSTEVDAVAASLECNHQSAASSRRPMRCRLSPKHRLEAD